MSAGEGVELPGVEFLFATPRLFGRQIGISDLDDMLLVYGDEGAMRWVGDGTAISREDTVRWIGITEDNYRSRGYGMTALQARGTGVVVGFIGLVHPGGQSEAEIKYALKRDFWGKGLATEAVRGMLEYGHRVHRLRHVIATVDPDNLASHRVLLKAGLVKGKLEHHEDGTTTQYFDWHAGR